MGYDLVIKNGMVVDGSGLPRYRADLGVRHGRIAAIGRIRERAREVIDADGQVVAPGFVDGHTHMDAQVFWDPLGTCSCWHGVTTVVMGNCGFTLAPCGKADRHLVVRNLERAEDIAAEAMDAGIDWTWTTFPEFLDRLEALPKGINYAGYIGHSALRTYVMGERAFEKAAGADDLRAMERELRDAIRAGAIGFTTSRSPSHETPERRPVATAAGIMTIIAMAYLTFLGAQAGSPTEIELTVAKEQEAGKQVAAQSGCLACHLFEHNGNAGPGPDLTHIGNKLPRQAIARSLVAAPGIMPSYKNLPEGKFNDLVDFLASLQ